MGQCTEWLGPREGRGIDFAALGKITGNPGISLFSDICDGNIKSEMWKFTLEMATPRLAKLHTPPPGFSPPVAGAGGIFAPRGAENFGVTPVRRTCFEIDSIPGGQVPSLVSLTWCRVLEGVVQRAQDCHVAVDGVVGTSRSQGNTILGAWENHGKSYFLEILEIPMKSM